MNSQRQVSRLNNILRQSLGEQPPFAWQYTGSLFHPVIAVEQDDSAPGGVRELMETICECGRDVRVHATTCQLSIRRKVSTTIRIMDNFPDAWVICQKVYPDLAAWNASFGTTSHYPADGYWFPFTIKIGNVPAIYLKTERAKLPNDEQTTAAIWAITEWRNQNPAVVKYEEERAAERDKTERHENLVSTIKECSAGATLNVLPGKRANASYNNVSRDPLVHLKPTIYNAQGVPV